MKKKILAALMVFTIMTFFNDGYIKVYAEGCYYTHSVTCEGNSTTRASEYLYLKSATALYSSVKVNGILNKSQHTIYVAGYINGVSHRKDMPGKVTQSFTNLTPGVEYSYNWGNCGLFAECVKGDFLIQRGGRTNTMTSMWHYIGF